MADTLTPDICVIGAGSGGLTVAAAAANFGVPVVLVERGKMGGDCLNYGCVPSKAMIAAARHAATIREAPAFGVSASEPAVDFAAVNAHIKSTIAAIAPNDSEERFTRLGVKVIREEARFLDAETIEAGGVRIKARRFVLAVGSAPLVPPIEGLGEVPFLTNETIFDQTRLPEHLVIVGGGPVGLEMAQAHRRLGSKVTIVEAGKAMAKEDPELAAIVLARLGAEGVALVEGAEVARVFAAPGGVEIAVKGGDTIAGSHLLIAAGRAPNLKGLGLEKAGVDHDGKGIKVGSDLRTSNRRIYAIGDAAGGPQFTHVANYHAGLVLRAILFRLPIKVRRDLVPRVTYTDPELGQVGLTEAEARDRGLSPAVQSWPYRDNDRAWTERRTEGLVKLVLGRRGKLLGAGVAGAKADEMTNLFSLALSRSMSASDLRDFISPYPTFGEIGKRAATGYYKPYAERRAVRGLLAALRRLG